MSQHYASPQSKNRIDYQIVYMNDKVADWVNYADFYYGDNGEFENQLFQIGQFGIQFKMT